MLISIHAPSRERPPPKCSRLPAEYFNPRSLTGATAKQLYQRSIQVKFQSTLPHGSDKGVFLQKLIFLYFNPRSLTGATTFYISWIRTLTIFQSTLPHGSDYENLDLYDTPEISIHAPSRERQHLQLDARAQVAISIHAPSRERRSCVIWIFPLTDFNPRSLTGATRWQMSSTIRKQRFQSTLPHGSDSHQNFRRAA